MNIRTTRHLLTIAALTLLLIARFAVPASAQAPRLSDIVEQLRWDAATKGPLLIVSPEETTARVTTWPPRPDTEGWYAWGPVAAFYGRTLVDMHSLTVFAPTTMTVLNDRLPSPDPYSGMSAGDKARWLQSTFTPAQWQRFFSAEGIGANDMEGGQRALYLSLLPEPFTIDSVTATAIDYGFQETPTGDPITLTPAQRENIRISLQKRLDWSFQNGKDGTLNIGGGKEIAPGMGAIYSLHGAMAAATFGTDDKTAYGVALTSELPNQSKASQLPASGSGLSVAIALSGVATVGDLIHRVAQRTGQELYADPRYGQRKLYIRAQVGQTARAGDLLRALALAVTGTWRRVGPAYLLTDDVEGLAVRHARISDWLSQNALFASARECQIGHSLGGVPADAVRWSDAGAFAPDESLAAKMTAFPQQAAAQTGGTVKPLFVPLTDLPPAAQAIARQQMKWLTSAQSPGVGLAANLRTDGVNVTTQNRAVYIVPGIGTLAASDLQSSISDTGPRPVPAQTAPAAPRPQVAAGAKPREIRMPVPHFPPDCLAHALLVAPRTDGEVAELVDAAAQRGFGQLWIQTPRSGSQVLPLLETAIRLGATRGLTVRAVVRPWQALATDSPSARDRNLLGDTSVEYVRRKQAEIRKLDSIADEGTTSSHTPVESDWTIWQNASLVSRLLARGNYLRGDDADVRQHLRDDLAKIAATPGLEGIVLRAATPPGYYTTTRNAPSASLSADDPLQELGYTGAMRLACLRKQGFDPIDVSPLPSGDQTIVSQGQTANMRFVDMSLPFFRDMGQATTGNADTTRDLLRRWDAFRAEANQAFLQTLADSLHASSPKIVVLASAEGHPESGSGFWLSGIDGNPLPDSASKVEPSSALPRLAGATHAESRPLYRAVTVSSVSYRVANATALALSHLQIDLWSANHSAGVVVDFSEVPVAQATAILQAFPVIASGSEIPDTQSLPRKQGNPKPVRNE